MLNLAMKGGKCRIKAAILSRRSFDGAPWSALWRMPSKPDQLSSFNSLSENIAGAGGALDRYTAAT
jgi:hypothetical protein